MPQHGAGRAEFEVLRDRIAFLPPKMRAARRWLVWRGKKVPFYASGSPREGTLDSPEDLARLVPLEEALAAIEGDSRNLGLGFALGFDAELGLNWQGIDLDDALSAGAFTTERGREIYQASAAYAERSPSGAGLHIIGLGPQFRSIKWHKPGEQKIECYSCGRYFTVTGQTMREGELEDLAPLVERIRGESGATPRSPRVARVKVRAGASGDYLARQSDDLRAWLEEHSIEAALAEHGFERCGDRWLSPNSESGVPGVLVLDALRAVSFHASDAGIGTQTEGDAEVFNAFDLAARFRFGGDRTRAMRELLNPPRASGQDPGSAESTGENNPPEPAHQPLDIFREIAAPALDPADFPPLLSEFAVPLARAAGHDPAAYLMAGLGAAAGAMGDHVRLLLDSTTSWFESARLWILLLGAPGTAKTPAIRAAMEGLFQIHRELRAQHAREVAALPKDEPQPPVPAVFVSDATIEKLSEILADNPRGIVAVFEELDTWLGAHDCYRNGQGSKDRGEWLRLFDGGPHQVDRIKRGSFFVANWGASILGATTPAGLRRHAKELPPDGLIQRFLPVIVRAMSAPNRHILGATVSGARNKFELRMRELHSAPAGTVRLSREAFALFDARRDALRDEVQAFAELSEPFAAHLAKHAGLLGRVALTMHGLECGADAPAVAISGETMQRAERLLARLMRHAMATFDLLAGKNSSADLARRVALSILASGLEAVSKNTLLQACRPFRKAEEGEQWAAITALEDAGWLLPVDGRHYRGRPSAWAVHPEAHTRFAEQAEKHRELRRSIAARLHGEDADE